MSRNIKTILFDLDGTLIDTNALIHASFKHTFDVYGYQFSDEEIKQFNGPPLEQTFKKLHAEAADEMIQTYREHNLANHNLFVKLFPEVKMTLEKLKHRGIDMGIVSTKKRSGVELGLEFTGLMKYFNTIITFDDIEQAKPHPEPVLKAMHEMNAIKEYTLMVGDNYHDIESGKNASIQTAGVAWSQKGASFLETYQPTYMLQNMADLLELTEVFVDAKDKTI
ncbi:MAG TPA: pyrophosphatase PpaX [Pseudogracilibacillus sp.]|nr:pyrophosphatase PpaX [Pseudogracilibacillus sp.]